MPVLCEAISVVVRRDSIDNYFQGGWDKFVRKIPNPTMCTDGELVRVGFMASDHVQEFIDLLESEGLQFNQLNKDKTEIIARNDFVVVDQIRGPMTECDWIEFGQLSFGEDKVSACWLFEGERKAYGMHFPRKELKFAAPKNWTPNDLTFVEPEEIETRYKFLRTEDGLDVFWDSEAKKEVFIPTTKK